MTNPLGPLVPADERFDHQIADTFATVGTSDPSWTEKVCAMAARRDGSLQLGFGMGKYLNRNVLDGYAGSSRGVEQLTVRGSRRLYPTADETSVGPVHYEVLEPMRSVRFRLEENDCQPLAFDWVFEGVVPPATEERTRQRVPLGYRVSADLVRYHHIGTASGWVEIDGVRHRIDPDEWVSTRDHSWGVRYDVGTPPTDTDPFDPVADMDFRMIWCPALMTDPDGSRWGLFLHAVDLSGFGHAHRTVTGAVEHADGTVQRMADIRPDLRFDPVNRRLLGGGVRVTMEGGGDRRFAVDVPTATGFHLGAGLYFGWQGHHHGEWRGDLVVDGCFLFPTLGVGMEEALAHDPEAAVAAFHAFNRWLDDDWSYAYRSRIFAAPMIPLVDVDAAVEELETVLERDARIVCIKGGPAITREGRVSPGDARFDPFWARVDEAGVTVGIHSGDAGYNRYVDDWEQAGEFRSFAYAPLRIVLSASRPPFETMAALVCQGVFDRFPRVRVASIEAGADWVPDLVKKLTKVHGQMPTGFVSDPVAAFREHVWIAPFYEDDLAGLRDLVGLDHVLFGSDWPHAEGLAEPNAFADDLRRCGFTGKEIRAVMSENGRVLAERLP